MLLLSSGVHICNARAGRLLLQRAGAVQDPEPAPRRQLHTYQTWSKTQEKCRRQRYLCWIVLNKQKSREVIEVSDISIDAFVRIERMSSKCWCVFTFVTVGPQFLNEMETEKLRLLSLMIKTSNGARCNFSIFHAFLHLRDPLLRILTKQNTTILSDVS